MKTVAFTLIVLGLALTAAPALAQTGGQTSFTLVGKEDQKWYLDGQTAANPTIEIAPSQTITVTMKQEGTIPHNLKVGENEASEITQDDGQTIQYTFTSPASGTLAYICELHAGTMKGTMRVFGTQSGGNGGGENGTPGLGLAGIGIAVLGAVLLFRRR